ncbi:hypothetical protein Leryth_007420 [Lithospermum erythrorhizon]|nr:hypothetical protein Leryth_007420 [Lithospermum erythrorhizon]
MGRSPCCDKTKVKRGPWSPEEDATLRDFLEKHGTAGNWIALPQKAGLKRCGKSCRLRWLNYLRPDIKHGPFSPEEDEIICNMWSVIAAQLSGRTDNDVKNHWNTKLKKLQLAANITTATNLPKENNNDAATITLTSIKTSLFHDFSAPLMSYDDTILDQFNTPPIMAKQYVSQYYFSPLSEPAGSSNISLSSSSLAMDETAYALGWTGNNNIDFNNPNVGLNNTPLVDEQELPIDPTIAPDFPCYDICTQQTVLGSLPTAAELA